MARISEDSFRQYRDGQDRLTAQEYMRDRELLRLAVNAVDEQLETVGVERLAILSNDITTISENVDSGLIELRELNENASVQIEEVKATVEDLRANGTGIDAEARQNLDINALVIDSRGRDLRKLGFNLSGEVDISSDVMNALDMYKHITIPPDGIVGTASTIRVSQGQSLTSPMKNIRGYGRTATIKYIGELDRHKAVLQIGKNLVDREPQYDGTDIIVENLMVDANGLAGFGIYGTFLTNESMVNNITVSNSLEYAFYFARSWYAQFTRLRALKNKGKGIALGMPLEYQDGSKIEWTTPSPLELNNCIISDLRAHSNGQHYSVDNPGMFNPANPDIRRQGYGIGFGIGNSFNVDKFVSEYNGGTGVYIYTGPQPMKTIKTGYMEKNAHNSGLDPATAMPNMIIEHVSELGGNYNIEDIFMNYDAGGICFTGTLGRKVWLKNIHQPRFLTSLDGLPMFDLYAQVLKDNVYYGAGFYNTLEELAAGTNVIQRVDTKGSFTVPVNEYKGYKLVYVKGEGTTPLGSFVLNFADGTAAATRSYPAGLGNKYVLATVGTTELSSITKGGATGTTASNVTFKVVNTPYTYI